MSSFDWSLGGSTFLFTAHKSGLQLHCSVSLKVKFTCSCDNDVERTMLMKHLEDAIDEVSSSVSDILID